MLLYVFAIQTPILKIFLYFTQGFLTPNYTMVMRMDTHISKYIHIINKLDSKLSDHACGVKSCSSNKSGGYTDKMRWPDRLLPNSWPWNVVYMPISVRTFIAWFRINSISSSLLCLFVKTDISKTTNLAVPFRYKSPIFSMWDCMVTIAIPNSPSMKVNPEISYVHYRASLFY